MLLATIYCKPRDLKNFLTYISTHPISLIKSIPYSQALCLEKMCTETSEFSKNLQMLKKSFINRRFNENFFDAKFQLLSETERNALLVPKSREKNQNRISFVLMYSKTLTVVKQIIN